MRAHSTKNWATELTKTGRSKIYRADLPNPNRHRQAI